MSEQQTIISLEDCIDKNRTLLLENFIEATVENPDRYITKNLLWKHMKNVLENTLNHREQDVLYFRYGLDGQHIKTLEEIGQIFEVSRERIRQIEARALRKLKSYFKRCDLREYLDLY